MTSEIRPGFILPIVKQLQNTTETDTYYLRAVIKDTVKGTVLKTVNLTDEGSYRFRYDWSVPSFSNETYIDISVTAYTDSGYTQISSYYGTWTEQYVIRNQVNFGGGGGSGLSYSDIERIIKAEIAKIKIPEYKETDLTQVLAILSELAKKNVDLSPLLSAIETNKANLEKRIDGIRMPELDTKPIIDALGENLTMIRELDGSIKADREQVNSAVSNIKEASDNLDTILEKGKNYFTKDIDRLEEKIDKIEKEVKGIAKGIPVSVVITKPLKDENE